MTFVYLDQHHHMTGASNIQQRAPFWRHFRHESHRVLFSSAMFRGASIPAPKSRTKFWLTSWEDVANLRTHKRLPFEPGTRSTWLVPANDTARRAAMEIVVVWTKELNDVKGLKGFNCLKCSYRDQCLRSSIAV